MGDWGVFVFDIIRFSGMSAGRGSDEKKHRKRNSFGRSGYVEISVRGHSVCLGSHLDEMRSKSEFFSV